jgi:fatty acid amide hydrolase
MAQAATVVGGHEGIPYLPWMGAEEMAGKIRRGELGVSEVLEDTLRRLQEVERLNAMAQPRYAEARREAQAADVALTDGTTPGPLHGVPITVKEQFYVKGLDTTVGVPHHAGRKAKRDGLLVARLRRAGAIVLGKTNVMMTLLGHECENPIHGRTDNPWDLTRTPGGSSGGEAALVAAGASPLGLGGDLGGSVRVPAHFCGIHGLKPTSGRLTNDDTMRELSSGQEIIVPQPGPMARRVEDLRLAMQVLAAPGPERTPELLPPVPWADPDEVSVRDLRVGFYEDDGYFPASPAIRRATREGAEILRERGVTVRPFTPPDLPEAIRIFISAVSGDRMAWVKRLVGPDKMDERVRANTRLGGIPPRMLPLIARIMESRGQRRLGGFIRSIRPALTTAEHWQLNMDAYAYRHRFLDAMDGTGVDVLLCPPFALPALPHGSSLDLALFPASYAMLYNVLGMPAGVVAATRVRKEEENGRRPSKDGVDQAAYEVDRGSAGLPVGVQVAARHWRDDQVLAVMEILEEGFRRRPDYPREPPI